MRTFSTTLVLILISTFAGAEIYKWADETGRIHFSDKPQHARADYYVPKTGINSFEVDRGSKFSKKRFTKQIKVKSSVDRQGKTEPVSVEKLRAKDQGREARRKTGNRKSLDRKRVFAETQSQHDRRTNYDGYGSELSRYQNAIIMKTHNSIIKGGNMEYWNGLDEYRYQNQRRGKVRWQRW